MGKTILFRIVGIIIPLFCWALFLFKQFDKIRNYEWEISFFNLLISQLFASIYFIFLAFNWALILRFVSVGTSDNFMLINSMEAWLYTIMSRYIPGNVWHVIGRMAYANKINAIKLQIISSSALEQIMAMIGATMLFALSLPFWPTDQLAEDWIFKISLFSILFFLALVISHPKFILPIVNWVGKRFNRPEIQWNFNYKMTICFALLYLFANLFMGLCLAVILNGFGVAISNNFVFILGITAFSWIIGYLSFFTPSGIGIREGALTALLSLIYPIPIAIVASLVFRIICTVGELLAIVIFTAYMKIK